jgi:hypothetical protein
MEDPLEPLDSLPATGYVRIRQLVGDPATGRPGLIPISRASIWRLVKAGKFPAPIKLSDKITVWRVEDIREWMKGQR